MPPRETPDRPRAPPPYLRHKGSGPGLCIVAFLVEAHHGPFDIDGQPGVDSTVSIHIPAHA
jgi:nitrogen-specific signal transduction histidine kinase